MALDLPYKIAVLCYIFDQEDRVLLLHRRKPPNRELYSPVGGKLEQAIGESPAACARREIREEVDLDIAPERLHLTGIVSETGYQQETHWLMFLYEVVGPVRVERMHFDEGELTWHEPADIEKLDLPDTDRQVIWPLFWKYRRRFFSVHIDCSGDKLAWTIEQPREDIC